MTPRDRAAARTKVVLPVPTSPESTTTSPGPSTRATLDASSSSIASFRPSSSTGNPGTLPEPRLHRFPLGVGGAGDVQGLVGGGPLGLQQLGQAGEVRDEERPVRRGVEGALEGERREDVAAVERYRAAPYTRDGLFPPRERPAGQIPEGHHDPGIDGRELGDEVRPARTHLGGLRRPGRRSRRAALDQRGQVDLLATEVERFEQAIEEHPRGSLKGFAPLILVKARGLTDYE